MAIEIVDFPIHSMVMFHSYVSHYQRVLPTPCLANPIKVCHNALQLMPTLELCFACSFALFEALDEVVPPKAGITANLPLKSGNSHESAVLWNHYRCFMANYGNDFYHKRLLLKSVSSERVAFRSLSIPIPSPRPSQDASNNLWIRFTISTGASGPHISLH